jgi:hypothetical protein
MEAEEKTERISLLPGFSAFPSVFRSRRDPMFIEQGFSKRTLKLGGSEIGSGTLRSSGAKKVFNNRKL